MVSSKPPYIANNWQVVFLEHADRQLNQLDKKVKHRIIDFLNTKVLAAANPRTLGKLLKGKLRSYWSFRVGDYRILTHIDDGKLIVLVVQIGHRREVYKHL